MFINIRNPDLDAALDSLLDAQPVRISKTALIEAILELVVEAYGFSQDPVEWMDIGAVD